MTTRCEPNPSAIALAPDEVHVYSVDLDQVGDTDAMLLAPEEQRRALRYRANQNRLRFVAARSVLRQVLGRYLGANPADLRLAVNRTEKPVLASPWAASGLRFKITHCDHLALVAVAHAHDIGVDVERVRQLPDLDQLWERYFAPSERSVLRTATPTDRTDLFFAFWSLKEAFLKATGDGLTRPLDSFEVSLEPRPRLVRVGWDRGVLNGWELRMLEPEAGYVGALAAATPDPIVRCWQYTPRQSSSKRS
jgi:4'-phosphopantetheinyl transferase